MSQRYAQIQQLEPEHSITMLCALLGVSRSGYYDWRGRGLGSCLLKLSMGALRERGETSADIGWVGPLPFYARCVDARITRAYWRFDKTLTP